MEKKKKKRSFKNFLINIFILLLLIVGLALVFNKAIRNHFIGKTTEKYQISNVSKKDIEKNKKAKVNFDFEKVESVNSRDILKNQLSKKEIADLPVIAGIAVPDVGINLPIFKGLDNDSIFYGAGTMKESDVMGQGNYSLASHHISEYANADKLLFTPLERAEKGMKIYVTDKEKIYEYEIDDKGIYEPNRVDMIEDVPGKTQITLVTCSDLEATARIIVTGHFVKEVDAKDASDEMLNAFGADYNTFK